MRRQLHKKTTPITHIALASRRLCASTDTHCLMIKPPRLLNPDLHSDLMACRAALYALYAAEALLLAFATKLRVSTGDALADISLPQPGSYAAAVYSIGNAYADQAASFLGSCLPSAHSGSFEQQRVRLHVPVRMLCLQPLSAQQHSFMCLARSLTHINPVQGARGALLIQKDGLQWLPTVGNGLTLGSFTLSLLLNNYLTQARRPQSNTLETSWHESTMLLLISKSQQIHIRHHCA